MKNIYLTKEYYGAKAFGAEWEEMKKNILAEMREKYKKLYCSRCGLS